MKKLKKILFRKEILILLVVVLIGSALRIQGTITNSFAYTYDVGRDMLALWDITHLIDFPFIGPTTGLPGVFYGPWWYYLLSPFFFMSGGNPAGIALLMNLVGIATIVLAYILGKKIKGEFLGLSFAAIVSVSPYLISLSSQIWNPNIAPFFVILTILVLEKINNSKKEVRLPFLFLGILLALSADIEVVYGVLFSLGVLVSEIVIRKFKFSLKEVGLFFLGVFLILLPRILFEVKNHFLMTKSFIMYFSSGSSQKLDIFTTIQNRASIFLSEISSALTGGNELLGILAVIFVILCTLAYFKNANDSEKNLLKISGIILVIFFVGTSFFSHDIWPHYLVGLPIIYILLFVIALDLLREKVKIFIPVLIVLIVFFVNFNPVNFILSLRNPYWEGDASLYRNQLEVIDYVYKNANGKKFKYVVFTPPVHDYTYQYLFKWYGPSKYGYSPSVNANRIYFIVEPDLQNPLRAKEWLLERAGDGRTISSKNVKGGIIVETREQK